MNIYDKRLFGENMSLNILFDIFKYLSYLIIS